MNASIADGFQIAYQLDSKLSRFAFSPDSQRLVVASPAQDTTIIDIGTWMLRTSPTTQFPPERVVCSPDGESFIITSANHEPLACVDTRTTAIRWSLTPGSMDADFSRDGKLIAATRAKSVLLCDATSGQILHDLKGHKSRVDMVRFSGTGRRVASAGQSQVCLWDVTNGELIEVVQEKKGEIRRIEFSGNGTALAVASAKGCVSFYDAVTGNKLNEWLASSGFGFHLEINADASRLIDFHTTYRLWDVASAQQVYQATPHTICKFTPDGAMLVILSNGVVELRSLDAGQLIRQTPLVTESPVLRFAVSSDTNWLACQLSGKLLVLNARGFFNPDRQSLTP